MIKRTIEAQLLAKLKDKKAILLLGPRQAGKSTLLEIIRAHMTVPVAVWDGDESDIREKLAQPTSTRIKAMLGQHTVVIIDEAQRIENIGLCIKLIVDKIKDVKVLASGSSSFELANKINEPLTGRKWEFNLFPLSFGEMAAYSSLMEERRLLNHRLTYGYYPEIVNTPGEDVSRLKQLADSYLYKDILTWERIQKPDKLEKLVQALAFQMAQLINYHELGQTCGLNSETVEKYINLLEKAFIVYRLPSYSRNLRNEIKKMYKIYFYDNGLRNAVINQFNPVNLRNDIGQLWENWFVTERLKFLKNNGKLANRFFWRTTAQQEIDYIEESEDILLGFECKWNTKSKGGITKVFKNAYPHAHIQMISPDNFEVFLV